MLLTCWLTPSIRADQTKEPASEAGVVQERIKKEADERLKPEHREPTIEGQPQPVEQPPPAETRFVLKEVILQGNTALPASAFTPQIDPYRNREITVAELKGLVSAIEQDYRRRGYLTTIAYLPPQRIEEGRVTIQVLEGRLGKVLVEGNRYFNATRILWYWPIQRGEVLRYQPIRAAVLRMNTHPDHQVQLLLRPGEATGETDVVLKVTEHFPLHVGSQWDNQGTPSIGRYRYGFSLGYNNLLGLDDRVIVGTVFGKRFGALYTQYLVPLTPSGTIATFGFSHSRVAPGRQFKPFGVNGTSETYSLGLSQPLLDETGLSLDLHTGFDFKESRTMQLSGTVRRERLRVLRVGPRLQLRDRWGGWSAQFESSFGIKGLGATSENNPLASRPGAPPDFLKTEFQLTRIQPLPWGTQASASLDAQVAASKLAPAEELYLGGADSVRGYPEGDYLADSGLTARFEYLIPCAILPSQWRLPGSKNALREQLQLVAFLDRGYGRLRAITGDERTSRNLMGLGGGVRFRLNDTLSARLEWGHAVGDRPLTDDSSSRLHFRIQSTL